MKLRFNKYDVLYFEINVSKADEMGNRYMTRGNIFIVRQSKKMFINDWGGWNNCSGLYTCEEDMLRLFMEEFFGIKVGYIWERQNLIFKANYDIPIKEFKRIEDRNSESFNEYR